MTREEAEEFIAQSVKSDIDMALVADAIEALSAIEKIKVEIGAKVFDMKPRTDGTYYDGIDDVMDIVCKVIDKHLGKESE